MDQLGLPGLFAVFFAAAAVILVAGIVLARTGDAIAISTGLGGLFIGVVLLAVATSLPEVFIGIAATLADAPDIAVGDIFGACMANMAVLALIDLTYRRTVWPSVEIGHARLGMVAIILAALALFGILQPSGLRLGWLGVETIAIAAIYVAALAWTRRATRGGELGPEAVSEPSEGPQPRLLRTELFWFAVAGLAILLAAPVVAISAKEIADETGVGEAFVGVALVAFATSLPELVATLAAARIRAYDLAVGNLFGSATLNLAILFIIDAAYTPGPVLSAIDPGQAVAAVAVILLVGIAVAALVHRGRTSLRRLEPDATLLVLAYLACLAAVWAASG